LQKDFLTASYGDKTSLMANGKDAMELMEQWAPWVYEHSTDNTTGIEDKFGFFTFPAVEEGAGLATDTMGEGHLLMILCCKKFSDL
jgi:hypothetical protein